ncbi:NHL repeat family protein [Mycobacterium xenopi 4042]|uniref:NHL repeat family protein n=1 Tax=Mycobacterium xenopi 4042 TaxID=1299334 RepID=X8E446_MYCXE|nr:NHL repeat family protein [Mycobacterium xenopi 3993]EUA75369.1 NHL repeat family protein [Mycobacterium xenopi 4042]
MTPLTGLDSPRGVAVDAQGNLYVVDTGNNRVLRLRPA